MALFDFLKTKQDNASNILIPKTCPTNIPFEIEAKIDKVNWKNFETAYGNAENTIPIYLKNLFCKDVKIALDATHQLWCSLCHQQAYISSAVLPSYDILKIALLELDDKLKIELLDIFQGFSEFTSEKYFTSINQKASNWEQEVRQKLISDIIIFEDLKKNTDEEISVFATNIIENLKHDRTN